MSRPAAMPTASAMPATCTGDRRIVVVPSPSWPSLLRPNSQIVPLLFSTIVWLCPVSTATLSVPSEVTWVGDRVLAVVPRPCCPSTLLPHVQTVPLDLSATSCSRPPCRSMTPLRPVTGPGGTTRRGGAVAELAEAVLAERPRRPGRRCRVGRRGGGHTDGDERGRGQSRCTQACESALDAGVS